MNPYLVPGGGRVDREAVVRRHDVRLERLEPAAPLQVGNGTFAFSVDVTGLQTFPTAYPVEGGGTLLGTMAQWAWHSMPADRPYRLEETLRDYATARGPVPYVDLSTEVHDAPGQTPAETWLRGNPHRLDLGRVGLAGVSDPGALGDVDQHLDLWSGLIESRFSLAGRPYHVTTAVHPERDVLGLIVRGEGGGPVGVTIRFPYGSTSWGNAADWERPDAHATSVTPMVAGWQVRRDVDETVYWMTMTAPGADLERIAAHELVITATGELRLAIEFGPRPPDAEAMVAETVLDASRAGWAAFWSSGAAVDLATSTDARAPELERRIVLSQFVTRVNCAGPMPPAETGLVLNSWRGKSHLEMHWFHGAHFAAWGRPELLEQSLAWYATITAEARATAARQGLAGARWPKQVGPEGRDTPSSIGPFLVWQQPHPIYLAELLYRADPVRETLERWADLVFDTAECMATFPTPDDGALHLGPPIVPAQESYFRTRAEARDPTFELAYWSWALEAATTWWQRMGKEPPPRWVEVARALAAPTVIGGRYAALGTPPYLVRDDHPSMLAALGFVPATRIIDPAVMSAAFDDAMADWDWASTWGWDYPIAAMTATRLGRPADALDALLRQTPKNEHLVNGHNRQSAGLPVYLPGNGGLLAAVALMVGGWDGEPSPALPEGWSVTHEGLIRLP